MGFFTSAGTFVVEEVSPEEAGWQLVVEVEPALVVVYLREGADVEFWVREYAMLYGVWPRVWKKGQFVEVPPLPPQMPEGNLGG